MMNYQIYLTEKCTRKCQFCNLIQREYIESHNNINKFISLIKSFHGQFDNFSIDLFGGEPLLNIEAIKLIASAFIDWCCKLKLITNADLLCNYINEPFIHRLDVVISAYDIFNDIDKYKNFQSIVKSNTLSFQYTFTQDDFQKIIDFKNICEKILKTNYNIIISHDPKSWNKINIDDLYEKMYLMYNQIFFDFYNKKTFILPIPIERHFKRYIQLLFDPDVKSFYCFQDKKKIFYHGNFIKNACLRLDITSYDKIDIPKRCINCKYEKICPKSCVAEYVNGDIPESLCIYNKVVFDVIHNNLKELKNDRFISQLLRIYVDEMYCH